MGTARNMFPSKDKRDLTKPILREDLIQYDDLNATGGGGSGVTQIIAGTNVTISSTGPSGTGNVTINASGGGGGGTVTGVTAVGPITSSGGTAPVISTSMATNRLIGRTGIGTGEMEEITVGTGLSLSGGTLSNSGLTAVPTIQQTINAGKSITNDVLTIGTSAGSNVNTAHSLAIGEDALSNVNGGNNIAIGYKAGASGSLKTNAYNVAIGDSAGLNITGSTNENIAIGKNALESGASPNNVAIGTNAGKGDTGGATAFGNSVFIGTDAGYNRAGAVSNTGDAVVAIGNVSMTGNSGRSAIGIGAGAGAGNSGNQAVMVGSGSGSGNTGDRSVIIGYATGGSNTGSHSVIIGESAGSSNTGGDSVIIGKSAGNTNVGQSIIALGTNAGANNDSSGEFIVSLSNMKSFTDEATAISYYGGYTLSANCLYLYYDEAANIVRAYKT